ncbi:26S proteasome non-ATPase regulatory subunit 12 [Pelomyxa schiedti]|nr:26S proteasome non-ATPase regulatory subunit 12 [Pelomyxa schiedti]
MQEDEKNESISGDNANNDKKDEGAASGTTPTTSTNTPSSGSATATIPKPKAVPRAAKKRVVDEAFHAELAIALPECSALAKTDLAKAVERLLLLEKHARNAEDVTQTSKVALAIVSLCWEVRDFKALNDNLLLLSKRRGQLKTVIQHIVQKGLLFVKEMTDPSFKATRMDLIRNLLGITEGKIFVEVERANLTEILAELHEKEGDQLTASKLMQEIQIETYGSLDRREKTRFILEQVRLCLATQDFVRGLILSNKVNRTLLLEKDMEELKLKFYQLMIIYYKNSKNYLEICRCYLHIYDTPSVQQDPLKWQAALKHVVTHSVLSNFGMEQADIVSRMLSDKHTKDLPKYFWLVQKFTTQELISWPETKEFLSPTATDPGITEVDVFATGDPNSTSWSDLRDRVIAHNLRVIARYYTQITFKRLVQLLSLTPEELEDKLSIAVVSKDIYARLDRPAGIVRFGKRMDASDVLNDWATKLDQHVKLVDDTCHLIHRENVAHKIPTGH